MAEQSGLQLTPVRCKLCQKLLFKASPDATGKFEGYCDRCKRRCPITLPLKKAPAPEATRGS